MRVKLILPALVEASNPAWRPIKYSLFPPLGLATLAAFLPDDDVRIVDEHVERLSLDDNPDLVGIQVYVSNAHRAYEIADHYRARGVRVILGGLHVTARPDEAAGHADTVFLGPGEDTFPAFLCDLEAGRPLPRYVSAARTLQGVPPPRRDLLRRSLYLVPNSIVVSRGCPNHCAFCYKDGFFGGGRSFYRREVDAALAEIESLPGRHLYFLDDHLLADPRFASALFEGMRGMGRLFQGAATVRSVLEPGLLDRAVRAGLRSLFIGFETLDRGNLEAAGKPQASAADCTEAVRRLDGAGVMINGSFVFGMDNDGPDAFRRTVDWALAQGIATATFHILTPYPGTRLFDQMAEQGRILTRDWRLYDTRHAVFRPLHMTAAELEAGYAWAYREFYRWSSIARGAAAHAALAQRMRHFCLSASWKKFERVWDVAIRARQLALARPALEGLLAGRFFRPVSDAGVAATNVTMARDAPLTGRSPRNAHEKSLELADALGDVQQRREFRNEGSDAAEIDLTGVGEQQPLDVAAVPLAPRDRLVHHEVLDARHLERGAAKIDERRSGDGFTLERQPGERYVDGRTGGVVLQQQDLVLLGELPGGRHPRHEAVPAEDGYRAIKIERFGPDGCVDVERRPRHTPRDDRDAADEHRRRIKLLEGGGQRLERRADAEIGGHARRL